jgi:hypothetical protein
VTFAFELLHALTQMKILQEARAADNRCALDSRLRLTGDLCSEIFSAAEKGRVFQFRSSVDF